ncbi:ABC transporter substrate-binding protein [Streptacidiphilus pinicola]|uniref:ABC transporter substrate-binding protein n=1 Tax=Streptacidiphilus pinicola TaxID=2219663 RepID=UPI001FB2BCA9|nr:ABC transporter substrate-binding protein [Streptacidiphilus pinicola]
MSIVQPGVRRGRRTAAALAVAASLAQTAAACTGQPNSGSQGNTGSSDKPVTITFWHGWSQPNELTAINANIAGFEKLHPNIKIKAVKAVSADTITQGMRATGANAPDVVSDFSTTDVGKFCSTGAWIDLNPLLQKDGIDPKTTFSPAMLNYTQYKGDQCSLPLLGDAYGLYYNVDMFKAAGISSPPKTFSELAADAVKLTKGDGSQQLGYMPVWDYYEQNTGYVGGQYGPTYFTSDGKSNLAADPTWPALFSWQKDLINKLGGYAHLEKLRTGYGDEFAANAFDKGKVAMQMDGEWRVSNLQQDNVKFNWATAPFPVPDDKASTYGMGFQTGTVIGINRNSQNQAAAWEFVKYMTTNTDALTTFANAIDNVPSTIAALKSPNLKLPTQFQTFLNVASNPGSVTQPATPDGDAYVTILQNLGLDLQSGKQTDVTAALQKADTDINSSLAQASSH